MSNATPVLFDVWLKELLPAGVRYSKVANASTTKECVDEAHRKGPGFYEIWNDRGSRMMVLNVPGQLAA